MVEHVDDVKNSSTVSKEWTVQPAQSSVYLCADPSSCYGTHTLFNCYPSHRLKYFCAEGPPLLPTLVRSQLRFDPKTHLMAHVASALDLMATQGWV